jgi:hypothetical protein
MTTLATKYTSSSALRLVAIEELLSRSATFQTRIGASNETDAKLKIYAGEITLEDVLAMLEGGTLEVARPCAIIGLQAHLYQQIGQGAAIQLGVSGAVWLLLVDNATNQNSYKLSLLDFVDWTGNTIDDIANLVAQDVGATDYTLWPFSTAHMFLEPFRQDLADRKSDDYWIVGYIFADAINGGGA